MNGKKKGKGIGENLHNTCHLKRLREIVRRRGTSCKSFPSSNIQSKKEKRREKSSLLDSSFQRKKGPIMDTENAPIGKKAPLPAGINGIAISSQGGKKKKRPSSSQAGIADCPTDVKERGIAYL